MSLRTLSVDELSTAADEMWRTNVLGTLLAIKLAHDSLRVARGSVTLTLSESAFGLPEVECSMAARSGRSVEFVSHLSLDLAPDIRVNGVAPVGTSGTALAGVHTLSQYGRGVGEGPERDARIAAGNRLHLAPRPEDHAGAYVYLADPVAAREVTGTVMHTDGGRVMQ